MIVARVKWPGDNGRSMSEVYFAPDLDTVRELRRLVKRRDPRSTVVAYDVRVHDADWAIRELERLELLERPEVLDAIAEFR